MCFFAPPRNGLRPLGGWGKRTDNISDYDLELFPPQFHFSQDAIKEFIIVFQNERDGKQETTVEPRFKKGQGIDKILGLPNDGFVLNSPKQLFSVRTQSTFRFLETHSKRRYKICICSVILRELSNLQGLRYYFPGNNVNSVSRK